LTELELKILNAIMSNNKISMAKIAGKLDITRGTVKEYVGKLKDKGRLVRKGKTSGGYWEVK
jgi:DNA-binding MarR family transcriptional regulator